MDRKVFLQYVIPITFLVFTNVNVVWQVTDSNGGPDRLYGFPLPYATSAYACSFCNDIAAVPLIMDFACAALVIMASVVMIDRYVQPLPTNRWSILLAISVSVMSLGLHFIGDILVQDNSWRLWLDISHTVISRSLQFGPLGL